MPTYQYACTECAEHLEAVQSFSDPALTVCPTCQGRLRKVFNSVGIVFKGSGFYRNDSRSNATNGEKPNGASSSESAASSSKSDTSATSTSSSSKSDTSSSSPASGSSSSSTAKAAASS